MTSIGTPRVDRDAVLDGITLSDLIAETHPLKASGNGEFVGLCPFHSERTPSFNVINDKRFYFCFGCGAHGNAIDWLIATRGMDFKAATAYLSGGAPAGNVVAITKAAGKKKQPDPIEYHWAPPPIGYKTPTLYLREFGEPTMSWMYRDRAGGCLGFVARYATDSGKHKTLRAWTWGAYGDSGDYDWRCKRWSKPTPLYGLEKLDKPGNHDKRIVLVSGEKACDAATQLMPDCIVLTWCGGDQGAKHADFDPIIGERKVILWMDADESGFKAGAALIEELAPMVELWTVDVSTMPERGWDAADALAASWSDRKLSSWLSDIVDGRTRLHRVGTPAAVLVDQRPEPEPVDDEDRMEVAKPHEQFGSADLRPWDMKPYMEAFRKTLDKKSLIKCDFNAAVPLRWSPELRGAVRLNRVRGVPEIVRAMPWGDKPGPITPAVRSRILHWYNWIGLFFSKEMLADAINCVADENAFNPLTDYLDGLTWDGVARLDEWLPTYAGAVNTPYMRAVGSRWMISGAARAYNPGCQADCMLVLEGAEGMRKTSLLRVLGGEYFTPLNGVIGASDGRASLQAATHWIVEMAELEAVNRASTFDALKAFMTTTEETMRLAYRSDQERIKRVAIFAGTTNKEEWLPLDGDHRRFWPVHCEHCDIDALSRDRDQLWAEAAARYKAGERWWIDESDAELVGTVSRARAAARESDEWAGVVDEWSNAPEQWATSEFSAIDIASRCLGVPMERYDRRVQMRVAAVLNSLGWTRCRVLRSGARVQHWMRPARG